MTTPQYDPAAFAAFMQQQQQQGQQAPAAPQAQFPQHQPGYGAPPQTPAPQGYPTAGYQQFAPQMPQGYAPQQYGQPQQPAAPPVNASLDDFFNQPPTGWGPAWSWKDMPMGTTYIGIVARPLTNADVTPQTIPGTNTIATFRDGRPQLVMRVPMNVQPDAKFADGKAQWYVQGQASTELARAMAEVGAPAGPPEVGAIIAVTKSGERKNSFGTMSAQYTVRYQRPEGAAQTAPQVPAQASAPVVEQPAAAPAAPQVPQAPAPAPVAPPAPPAPAAANGLPADKAALLASLTGQSAGS